MYICEDILGLRADLLEGELMSDLLRERSSFSMLTAHGTFISKEVANWLISFVYYTLYLS